MVKSLTCKYRDIVGIFAVKSLKAEMQLKCYREVMKLIHKIGFHVVGICVDNAAANRKFYSLLCDGPLRASVKNPYSGRELFLLFDLTHNVKNLYNNFVTRRVFK